MAQAWLSRLATARLQAPSRTMAQMIAANVDFSQELTPVSSNRATVAVESAPFPKAGMNSSTARSTSSAPQMSERYLSANALFSSAAASMISSGQISSSIETEKKRDSAFSESMLG